MDNIQILNDNYPNSKIEDIEEMIIDKHFIKKDKIVQILVIPPDERTEEQNAIIQSYILDISDISKKFANENIEENDYKEIITNSINTCQYKLVKSFGNLIYNINE